MASATNALVVLDYLPLDLALKKLKGKLLKVGVFKEMKRRSYYEKPSLKRRRKRAEALRKVRKAQKQRAEYERRDD